MNSEQHKSNQSFSREAFYFPLSEVFILYLMRHFQVKCEVRILRQQMELPKRVRTNQTFIYFPSMHQYLEDSLMCINLSGAVFISHRRASHCYKFILWWGSWKCSSFVVNGLDLIVQSMFFRGKICCFLDKFSHFVYFASFISMWCTFIHTQHITVIEVMVKGTSHICESSLYEKYLKNLLFHHS